jgi:peptidoglycan/xylan/chitin deacetylase (PgdA/CDA1 family)
MESARPRSPAATVVISYDDGYEEEYTHAFPLHQKYEVPGEVCIPSCYVGMEGRLTASQLLEMQSAGWEIASHTRYHVTLGEEPLLRNASRGETKIFVGDNTRFRPGTTEIRISFGRLGEEAIVTDLGSDARGAYLVLDREIENDYVAKAEGKWARLWRLATGQRGHSIVGLSADQAYAEIVTSKLELEAMGLEVRHFAYPYGRYSDWTRDLVSRHYESARAGGRRKRGSATRTRTEQPDLFALPSVLCDESALTDGQLDRVLDETLELGGLRFLHAHTRNRGTFSPRLERIITGCLGRGLVVSTRREYFGAIDGRTAPSLSSL